MNDPKRQYGTILMRAPFSGDGHTIISNSAARNRRLSFKARGILLFLGSHVEGWETSEERLAAEATEKLAAVRSGLAELEEDGYMYRFRERLPNGQRGSALWIFSDDPAALPFHVQVVLERMAREGRRFDQEPVRTRESVKPKRRRKAETIQEPGCDNHMLEPESQNPSSAPGCDNHMLEPGCDQPMLANHMPKKTNVGREGEERDARARANDGSGGVEGERRYPGVSLASRDLIATITRDVLPQGQGISEEEWTELAALLDAMRPTVEVSPISWEEYTAWLAQGWVHPDGRPAYRTFHGALRWRLSPERVRGEAYVWALQQRAAQDDSGPQGGRDPQHRDDPFTGTPERSGTCGVHGTALTTGVCIPCENEVRAEQNAEARRWSDSFDDLPADESDEVPSVEELAAQLDAAAGGVQGEQPTPQRPSRPEIAAVRERLAREREAWRARSA
ncbi:hypothetical protein GCM10027294_53440 [Marinactinospora endophytica]